MTGHPPALLDLPPKTRRPAVLRPAPSATRAWTDFVLNHRGRRMIVFGILFSVAAHVLVLFGFNGHRKVVVQKPVEDPPLVLLTMPDLKDLDEPDPQPNDDGVKADAGITVPTLADSPAQVDMSSFVQDIDFSSMTKQDVTLAKTLTIPTHINHGGKVGSNLGKVFDLKDLDHHPEPTLRIKPIFPAALKHDVEEAEVTVGFVVTATGDVVNAYIVSSTDHRFDDAATVAMLKWKFRPGIKGGRKVPAHVAQPLRFRQAKDDE